MRTTVNLETDVVRAVEQHRREHGVGLSEAVNQLVRNGVRASRVDYAYAHPARDLGARVDLTNVAEVLELLDEVEAPAGARTRRHRLRGL
ncbi:MAG: CopG family transcriptional regulator [Dermatophilaceae bacterium]